MDWKKLIKQYKHEARGLFNRSEHKKNLGDMRELQEEGVEFLVKAGDLYTQHKKKRKALVVYDTAYKYAWPKESKRDVSKQDIQKKIRALSGKRFEKGLGRLLSFLSIGCLSIALLFISFNLTGYAIGSRDVSALASVFLFILGIVFALVYFREKRKNK